MTHFRAQNAGFPGFLDGVAFVLWSFRPRRQGSLPKCPKSPNIPGKWVIIFDPWYEGWVIRRQQPMQFSGKRVNETRDSNQRAITPRLSYVDQLFDETGGKLAKGDRCDHEAVFLSSPDLRICLIRSVREKTSSQALFGAGSDSSSSRVPLLPVPLVGVPLFVEPFCSD